MKAVLLYSGHAIVEISHDNHVRMVCIDSLYTGSPFSVLYHNRSIRQNTVLIVNWRNKERNRGRVRKKESLYREVA